MPSTQELAGFAAGLVLAALALLHLAWAFGVRWGAASAVPERGGAALFRPGPIACLAVAAGLAGMALLTFARSDAIALPLATSHVRTGVLITAAIFAARAIGDRRYVGFFKTVTDTRFAELDSRFYSPLCAALAALLLFAGA